MVSFADSLGHAENTLEILIVLSNVLLVAGTHGNEINAPWLFEQWDKDPSLLKTCGMKICREIGNPLALKAGKRYIDRDLNRSFNIQLNQDLAIKNYEIKRAQKLISGYGLHGKIPCKVAIDLHTTTSVMGSSLVVYGRRHADLALASLIQNRLGLPVYLHEDDAVEKGFLVESWPCGLVVEIGPVAQSLLDPNVVHKYRIILEVCFEEMAKVVSGKCRYPDGLIVYCHLGSIDFPRDNNNEINAIIHAELLDKSWQHLEDGSPLFVNAKGEVIRFDGKQYKKDQFISPVFVNEAAYREKLIAMSITKREKWLFKHDWHKKLYKLLTD